jgi:hypothetical protein
MRILETRVVQLEKALGVGDDIGDMTDGQIDAELSAMLGLDVTGIPHAEVEALIALKYAE